MKFVLASRNQKKIAELRTLLSEELEDVEILSLDDVGIYGEIEEDGETFEENALIKARVAAKSATRRRSCGDRFRTDIRRQHNRQRNYRGLWK